MKVLNRFAELLNKMPSGFIKYNLLKNALKFLLSFSSQIQQKSNSLFIFKKHNLLLLTMIFSKNSS